MITIRHQMTDLLDWFVYRHIPIVRLFVLFLVGVAMGSGFVRAVTPPTPRPAPITIIATAAIQPLPTPAAMVAAVSPRFVVAFDAPNGTAMGPIPAPALSAVLARFGDAWVLVPWEAGRVWVRAADVGLPDVADLQPTAAPQVVYQPVYQAPIEPAAAPTPALAAVPEPQQMVILDRDAWAVAAAAARAKTGK